MKTPYDLSHFKLQLPCDDKGNLSGHVAEITPEQLMAGYQGPYFQNPGDGTLTFLCPDGGAHTPGATCARSELRDLHEFTYKDEITDTLTFSVEQIQEGKEAIVWQIHDANEPWTFLAIAFQGGVGTLKLFAHPKDGGPHESAVLLTGIKLHDKVTATVSFKQLALGLQHVKARANGKACGMNLHRAGQGGNAYLKRGLYNQDNSKKGNIAIIKHW